MVQHLACGEGTEVSGVGSTGSMNYKYRIFTVRHGPGHLVATRVRSCDSISHDCYAHLQENHVTRFYRPHNVVPSNNWSYDTS